MCLKTAGSVSNNIDPNQILHSAVSDRGLNCLGLSVPVLGLIMELSFTTNFCTIIVYC